MAMTNMNLIVVFVTKLWPVQALACGGGETKNVIPLNFSNFGYIITSWRYLEFYHHSLLQYIGN